MGGHSQLSLVLVFQEKVHKQKFSQLRETRGSIPANPHLFGHGSCQNCPLSQHILSEPRAICRAGLYVRNEK